MSWPPCNSTWTASSLLFSHPDWSSTSLCPPSAVMTNSGASNRCGALYARATAGSGNQQTRQYWNESSTVHEGHPFRSYSSVTSKVRVGRNGIVTALLCAISAIIGATYLR